MMTEGLFDGEDVGGLSPPSVETTGFGSKS
jgi:hypothetical protein